MPYKINIVACLVDNIREQEMHGFGHIEFDFSMAFLLYSRGYVKTKPTLISGGSREYTCKPSLDSSKEI